MEKDREPEAFSETHGPLLGEGPGPGPAGPRPAVSSQARQVLQIDFDDDRAGRDVLTLREWLRGWCQEALDKGGEIAGLKAIARVADAYAAMGEAERDMFFELLKEDFGVNPDELDAAIDAYRAAQGARVTELAALARTAESPRMALFRLFNTIPESIKFLVDLRADLEARLRRDPELKLVELDLLHIMLSWFNIGFLQLQRISWNSPAALLEKLVNYEAVHEIRSWMDLKRRLAPDRACFAFIHPSMPMEPIIFVEVALVNGLTSTVEELLRQDGPHLPAHQADTAIFYSITNAQRGLRGIHFGNMLIKKVAIKLRGEVPGLRTFATLSPLPRFRRDFLEPALADGRITGYFSPGEASRLVELSGSGDIGIAVAALLSRKLWHEDPEVSSALRPGLLRAAHAYLTTCRPDGQAVCSVAHFHASNGAMLRRLNWLGNTSLAGLERSAGIMVNYLYDMEQFEEHQQRYRATGRLPVSPDFEPP